MLLLGVGLGDDILRVLLGLGDDGIAFGLRLLQYLLGAGLGVVNKLGGVILGVGGDILRVGEDAVRPADILGDGDLDIAYDIEHFLGIDNAPVAAAEPGSRA